jgi:diphthine synthase
MIGDMMGILYIIGLGLYDEQYISIKGLNAIKNCDEVYAEFYTGYLPDTSIKSLERTIGKRITVLTRADVEESDIIIETAKKHNVAFIVPGDPMTATTHIELRLRAIDAKIEARVIHGASIFTAVSGLLGLQHYRFGRTTTLPFPEGNYFPESPYEIIRDNLARNLHTLVLLDIDAERERYMSANEGMELLLTLESKRREHVITRNTLICVVARAGAEIPVVRAGYVKDLMTENFGSPLHTLVVPTPKLHFKEAEALVKLAGAPPRLLLS